MDLMNYSQETFEAIEADYRAFADELQFENITAIPVSALRGDNVVERASSTQWYKGSTLLGFLGTPAMSIPCTTACSKHARPRCRP